MTAATSVKDLPLCFGDRKDENQPYEKCRDCLHYHDCLISGLVAEIDDSIDVDMAGEPYVFPAPDSRRYIHQTNGALVDEINLLIQRSGLATSTLNYDAVRGDLCAIHIEMNHRQQYAPRFRPQPSLQAEADTVADENLARDRQVIDLHWRANSNNKPMIPVDGYDGIFDCEQFNFKLAGAFAQLNWRQQTKVIHLHLTEEMQWEHAIIQAPNIRDKWRTIQRGDVQGWKIKQEGAPHIQTRLHQSMADAPHLRKHIPGLVHIWMARRIAGDSPSLTARVAGLIAGEEARDPSAVRRAMATLDTRLASTKR